MSFEVTTLERNPEVAEQVGRLAEEGWPAFLLHGDTKHWDRLFDDFAEYQILFREPAGGLIAVGHAVPFVWVGTPEDLPSTMSELLKRALRTRRDRSTPNTLSALAAIVTASHQRSGLSAEILRAMRSLAAERGMPSLVAPVRPTLKSSYPLTPLRVRRLEAGRRVALRPLAAGSLEARRRVPEDRARNSNRHRDRSRLGRVDGH